MSEKRKQPWFFSHYSNCHGSLTGQTTYVRPESGNSHCCEKISSGSPDLIIIPIQRIRGKMENKLDTSVMGED